MLFRSYRETIKKSIQQRGRHKKQSGGHGQFGDVVLEIRPLGRGEGFQFENKVVGGAVPKQFIPAVESGARDHLEKGPLGFPVVDVSAKFMIPSKFGDDVDIVTSIHDWKRSSFRVHHRLMKGNELAIEGFETRVWVGRHPDKPDGIKSRPIPRELIDRFRSRATVASR